MTFPTGQMEPLGLTEVKGTAPGCQGPPRYLRNQDLPGSRALVVSKAWFQGEGKTPVSRRA